MAITMPTRCSPARNLAVLSSRVGRTKAKATNPRTRHRKKSKSRSSKRTWPERITKARRNNSMAAQSVRATMALMEEVDDDGHGHAGCRQSSPKGR